MTNLLTSTISEATFALLPCFLFIFTCEALPHRGLLHTIFCIAFSRICRGNLPWEFAVGIWQRNFRRNLLWLFAARICLRNLPWEFAQGICRGHLPWVFCIGKQILFCIYEQILFIWKQTFFIFKQNFIKSVSFRYCLSSYAHCT